MNETLLNKIHLFSILLAITCVLAKIYVSNCLVVDSHKLNDYYREKISLEKEISRLSYVDSGLSSITAVEKKAYELGFVKMTGALIAVDLNGSSSIASLVIQ